MTKIEVDKILSAICEDNENRDGCVQIEIMHGPANSYTVIPATFPAWEFDGDILQANTDHGTRWIAVESIHCIGI